MSQVIGVLDHFFEERPSSEKSWRVKLDSECPELLTVWHIDHLILVYDMRRKRPLFKWYEEEIQMQGLEDALTYLVEKKIKYRDFLNKKKTSTL